MKFRWIPIVILMLGLPALAVDVGRFLWLPPSAEPKDVVVSIDDGMSFGVVVKRLADAGVVSRSLYFLWLGRAMQVDRAIQAGDYALQTSMLPREVLERLRAGVVIKTAVTIPEGYAMRDIAAQLEAQELISADRFLSAATDPALIDALGVTGDSLEGYLFPSTYYVTRRTTAEMLVRRMVQEFHAATDGLDWSAAAARKLTRRQVVTLASIIEKETARDEERPLIAAVFLNRLQRRMPLQSDPTVIYALVDFDGNLHKRDLSVKSPYNTYVVPGLPPGPIANPGVASIEAVLHPASTKVLYFVSKNDGTHFFSATFAEHQRAVAKYQPPVKKRRTAPTRSAL